MDRLSAVPVHVEVCLKPTCRSGNRQITEETLNLLAGGRYILRDGPVDFSSSELLSQCVASVAIVDMDDSLPSGVSFWQGDPRVHVFRLSVDGPEQEMIDGAGEEEEIAACDQWILPSAKLEGVWESLVLEQGVKNRLLEYATTALLFTDKKVSKNVISWNRVVLLHGPPGTGKTSLCKALAHKLSIRLGDRYSNGQLLEINAHSLFSKWFSESGKLVQRLFEHILELADDENSLVCVLVDEVESLTAARSAAMGGNEPSDAVRVVNAVLTQIDNLRERDNVLILTTSNVSEAIDLAFVDRADIKQYIGLPTAAARYQVLHSCVEELTRVGIITTPLLLPRSRTKATELLAAKQSPAQPKPPPPGSAGASSISAVHRSTTNGTTATEKSPSDRTKTTKPSSAVEPNGRVERGRHGKGGDDDDGMDTSEDRPGLATPQPGTSIPAIAPKEDQRFGAASVSLPQGGRAGLLAAGETLVKIADLAEGLSGRALRKLPFQAHAFYVQRQSCTLSDFLSAMERAVRKEVEDRQSLELHR